MRFPTRPFFFLASTYPRRLPRHRADFRPQARGPARAAGYALALLSGLACQGERDADGQAERSMPIYAAETPDRAEACSGRRWIGINPDPDAECPKPTFGEWTYGPLFEGTDAPELRSYCLYESASDEPQDPDAVPIDTLAPDCEVVVGYGHGFVDNNAVALEDAFMVQTDVVISLPKTSAPPTRVVVVDSAVCGDFPDGGDGVFEHGKAMSMMIRNLACPPGGPCLATVATELALPLVETPKGLRPNFRTGGYLGGISQMAVAIVKAMKRAGPPGSGPLIINLSIGWDGRWGGEITTAWSDLEGPFRAVNSALAYASCQGALVIAAAGNAGGGPDARRGPAYPAAWESEAAPDARCANLGGGPVSTTPSYRPLVYGASAVDGADVPLANERPKGRARLVAPAGHVVVSRDGIRSKVYSGSSVSTAVLSAAAATVWTYDDGLTAHDVMQKVYDGAVRLTEPAHLCIDMDDCGMAHRVSMCGAVTSVCQRGRCGPWRGCLPSSANRDARAVGLDWRTPTADVTGAVGGQLIAAAWPCTRDVYAVDPAATDTPCPHDQHYSPYTMPYAAPQPPEPACPSCGIKELTLNLGISNVLSSSVSDGVMNVTLNNGSQVGFSLNHLGPFGPGDTVEVELVGIHSSDIQSATIDFVLVGENLSTSTPLIVE